MASVALVKGDDRYRNINAALNLIRGGIDPESIRGKQVLVKPNLVNASKPLTATHVDATRAVIDFVEEFNPGEVIVAEATAEGSTSEAYHRFGYDCLEGVRLVDINDDDYELVNMETLEDGERKVSISKTVLDADYIVSVARAKTHDCVFCTLTIKNMMGTVPHVDHQWIHGGSVGPNGSVETAIKSNYVLSKNLVTIFEKVGVNLGVVDGYVGMEGDGPIDGTPVYLGLAAAGLDCVAVDAVMTNVMGFDPRKKGDVYLADEKGLGVGDLNRINVVGEKMAKVRMRLKPNRNYHLTQRWWMKYHLNYNG